MEKVRDYFTNGIFSRTLQTLGSEVETQFLDGEGRPISTEVSQQTLTSLVSRGWSVDGQKGDLITALADSAGNKIYYELGRHNIEVATVASVPNRALDILQACLDQLYEAAYEVGAVPYFAPLWLGDEDLLVIPDERDAIWLELDSRSALAPLARTSAVQFTISIAPDEAIAVLNALGDHIDLFLSDFPQDAVWKQYIADSTAGYLDDRYGGPLCFESLDDYCHSLIRHDVVEGVKLVPFKSTVNLDIPLYLRSVWWHFRLKRYGNALCVEVRPMARRTDGQLRDQLEKVLNIVGL